MKIKTHRLNNTKNNIHFMNKMIYRISEKLNQDKLYYFTQFNLIGVICLSVYYIILLYKNGDLF